MKTCTVTHVTIEGKIECSNSQLNLKTAKLLTMMASVSMPGWFDRDCERYDSWREIAIRARGESKVILKQPYIISDDDYVVMEPKSSVTFQDKEQKSKPSNTPEAE